MNEQVDWKIISAMYDHSHLPPPPPPRNNRLIYRLVWGILFVAAALLFWY